MESPTRDNIEVRKTLEDEDTLEYGKDQEEMAARETRQRTLTEKGHQYQKELKTGVLKNAMSSWRKQANHIECLIADSGVSDEVSDMRLSVDLLSRERNKLYNLKEAVEEAMPVAEYFHPEGFPFNVDALEERHDELAKLIRATIVELTEELRSVKSQSTVRTRSSKHTYKSDKLQLEQEQFEQPQGQQVPPSAYEVHQLYPDIPVLNPNVQPSSEQFNQDFTHLLSLIPEDKQRTERYVQESSVASFDNVGAYKPLPPYIPAPYSGIKATKSSAVPQFPTKSTLETLAKLTPVVSSASNRQIHQPLHQPQISFRNQHTTTNHSNPQPVTSLLSNHPTNPGVNHQQPVTVSSFPTNPTTQLQPVISSHTSQYPTHPALPHGNSQLHDGWQTPTNTDALAAMLRLMKRPQIEVKPFSGNPLDYFKFVRHFKSAVAQFCDKEELMGYLEQYTTGEAHRITTGFSHLPPEVGFTAAMDELKIRYGDPQVVANAYIDKVLNWPTFNMNDTKALDDFSILLTECKYAIGDVRGLGVLEYAGNMRAIIRKLPVPLHDKWRNIAQRVTTSGSAIRFEHLVDFVSGEARKGCDVLFGREALKSSADAKKPSDKPSERPKKSFATVPEVQTPKHAAASAPSTYRPECKFCKDLHYLSVCAKFASLKMEDKINFVKEANLCFGCLKPNHVKLYCRSLSTCSVCKKNHPTVMHREDAPDSAQESVNRKGPHVSAHSSHHMGAGLCTLAIVPVTVNLQGKIKCVQTYAFLDPGSSVCFCTNDLLEELGGSGRDLKLKINTMGTPCTMATKEVHGLQIRGISGDVFVSLPEVYTKREMPVGQDHIPTNDDLRHWPHLRDIQLPDLIGRVGLLIGNNVPDVYSPYEVRTGERGSPHASRTAIGWIPWNIIRQGASEISPVVNRVGIEVIEDHQSLKELDILVRKSINQDFPERTIDDRKEQSVEDKAFMVKVNETIKLVDSHYYIDLPLREDDVIMPDNQTYIRSRLEGLKRRLNKSERFKEEYVAFMEKMFAQNHAEPVPEDSIDRNDGKVWYLPHHGVMHPTKNKLRVVFDCAALHDGVSLNAKLLQSPNLTNSLVGVLFRFREEAVGIMGDIEKMYHQVRVPDKNRDLLRFLWWPRGDTSLEPVKYRMCVHLFGATSSPACAVMALLETAKSQTSIYDESIIQTVFRNFYVDDCLKSVPSDVEAVEMIRNLKSLCAKGGFNVTKWVSNSSIVSQEVSESYPASTSKHFDVKNDVVPMERALGVSWNTADDNFSFTISIKDKKPTRRGVLSLTSSVYDPMGFAAPCILLPKMVLREMCGQGWDDMLPDHLLSRWNDWLAELPYLEDIKVPRCLKAIQFGDVKTSQLHHFSDASEDGYGTVSYMRTIYRNGATHCVIVCGKSRVTPLKKVTIPRLELTAARMAVQINKHITDELSNVDEVYYWTDSTSVLKYLANSASRFHTFVANRVSVIQEASSIDQWNYVPSKENPADLASRGAFPRDLKDSIWFRGPDFLWHNETEWPQNNRSVELESSDPEVINAVCSLTRKAAPEESLLSRFSSYSRCKAAIAWINIYLRNLKLWAKRRRELEQLCASITTKRPDDIKTEAHEKLQQEQQSARKSQVQQASLTKDDLVQAENTCLQISQRLHFASELRQINKGAPVQRSSVIARLDPVVQNQVICVGGRVSRANISEKSKHPAIIPKGSCLAELLIQHTHRLLGHSGKNAILAQLNENFWIVGANQLVKRLLFKCTTCRRYRATTLEQKMADLPKERLSIEDPPFTHTGCDYFGPFDIKRGRVSVKRYGVVFTCLTTRAVHFEVADDLSTDSCINAIRRFIARRGKVASIRSDNGTNLVGANRELRRAFDELCHSQVQSTCAQSGIKWFFNPPSGSHFGGSWERIIRSARRVLYGLLKERPVQLDDESFRTLLCEVEYILNSRPLTRVQDGPDDSEPLTPNHLLLFKSSQVSPPGLFAQDDTYTRKRWRYIQYLTNVFWQRWVKEYLPFLQERQKWLQPKRNVTKDDVVLIVDTTSRGSWTLGRVDSVVPDRHGVVRIVNVKTQTGVLQRPVDKLCMILEAESEDPDPPQRQ